MPKRNKKYNAQYFYDLFRRIPAEKWGKDEYRNAKGQRCALGHLRIKQGSETDTGYLTQPLRKMFVEGLDKNVVDINDDSENDARTNILNALKKLKAMGY